MYLENVPKAVMMSKSLVTCGGLCDCAYAGDDATGSFESTRTPMVTVSSSTNSTNSTTQSGLSVNGSLNTVT